MSALPSVTEQNSATASPAPLIFGFATQGSGGDDERRLRVLLEPLGARFLSFDRRSKRRSFSAILGAILRERPDLVVVEGTGWAGGLAAMIGRIVGGVPYVVSSGDAVGPFVASLSRLAGPLFAIYERLLCRLAAGFIGWTPYLVGRALTFGTPRAMTASNWAFFERDEAGRAEVGAAVRARLGIPADALVIGIVGSLSLTRRIGFCYGRELVEALDRCSRPGVVALIVGDGSGRAMLEKLAGPRLGRSIVLTGRVSRDEVPDYLAAMDLASLPQSVDGVGSFRYTTKISEYLAAGLPIVTGQIPAAYDLDDGWLWRLPGPTPWDSRYLDALGELLERLTPEELAMRRVAMPATLPEFDRARQVARATAFLSDIVDENRAGHPRRSRNRMA